MTDEIFSPKRKKIDPAEFGDGVPKDHFGHTLKEPALPEGHPFNAAEAPFKIQGNIPPAIREMMANRAAPQQQPAFDGGFDAPPERRPMQPMEQGSDKLTDLLNQLSVHQWEPFEFLSKGKFYDNIPALIHLRPMTGEEEQILATSRLLRSGKAVDMIFQRCIREKINPEMLLSADRIHLLIYLRGISYTPQYDVEVKCPSCGEKFAHIIDLDQDIDLETCPDSFTPENLKGKLPVSGFSFAYRLPTGADEQEIQNYRARKVQQWGSQGEDDTMLYRIALLLDEIEGITMKKELTVLLKKLSVQDVSHLRNEINNPPFGVNTSLVIPCPACYFEFDVELPFESNFFFPRKKTAKTQA
jgi:hypothetical protein